MAQADFQPSWATIKKPVGYPNGPSVGKPEMLLRANASSLYHRLSPYSNYDQGSLIDWGDEPFYYIYPDQNTQFPNSAKKYESTLFPLGSATIDVIRTSKFLVSGRGVQFLAKQFLLQTGNAYNETRIYNPTSPIVAAGLTLTLGSARPTRMFDTSGGLVGIANTLLGDLGSTIFGPPKTNPVSGTAADINPEALPQVNKTTGTKGLLRAGTAIKGQAHLQGAWPEPSNGSLANGFLDRVKGVVTDLFSNFIPQTQKDILYRSDEGAYGMMIGAGDFKFSYSGNSQDFGFGQTWIAGKSGTVGIRKKGQVTNAPYKIYVKYQNGVLTSYALSTLGGVSFTIPNVGSVGYNVSESGIERKPGYRYGDSMGAVKSDDYEASEMMVQYKLYVDETQKFPTKDPEATKPDALKVKNSLDKILNNIKQASGGIYTVQSDSNAVLLMNGSTQYNYDRTFKAKNKNQSPINYEFGALKAYRDSGVRMVSNDIATGANNSYKLPTAGHYDAINTLNVLDKDKKTNSNMAGWDTWQPYKDDLIAMFFYDVVNDKYIPFRAAIKGLSESGNASWEEMPFIGRADKVYSYGGFNRNCSFTLKVVVSSIKELAPTWQRINYMATSYKPANYTKSDRVSNGSNTYDRFMVPPMFFLTLGDFYRDQPILIQSLTVTVPDDAIWETQNEDSDPSGWNYMAGLIKTKDNLRYGQMPREVDLGFTVTLLEKERAVVGGANFGHAPRTEDFGKFNTETPNGKTPNKFNQSLLVDVING